MNGHEALMKAALIQMNPTVGALQSNVDRVLEKARQAYRDGAQLIVFPELVISGYPPEDLILKDHFCADCDKQLHRLKAELPPDPVVVVGAPVTRGGKKFNAAMVFRGGEMIGEYHKMLLPNYGVFDEKRLFEPGTDPFIFEMEGQTVAIHICEDSWYADGAAITSMTGMDIDLLINLSASPYHRGKLNHRIEVLAKTAQSLNAVMFYCNMVGGQDELVFDGASMVIGADGTPIARARQFRDDIL
ncbi:MAG TPA: nitrilase-related carbon-nitrogen hydrolase, partial [Pontiella sp.]|nr:nitrilase-related carbon-nitrogen hydrolase [Pontiella sp.]